MISIEVDDRSLHEAMAELRRQMQELGRWDMEVGLLGSPGRHRTREQLWRVAWINELGVVNEKGVRIPPRPFITQARMRIEAEFPNDVATLLSQGAHPWKMWHILGEKYAQEWRDIIDQWTTPPNAPATVRRKGFNDPLVETGAMRDAVTYKVHISSEDDAE